MVGGGGGADPFKDGKDGSWVNDATGVGGGDGAINDAELLVEELVEELV